MGTGLIFAILVVGWLAYLVPWFLSLRSHDVDEVDLQGPQPFSESTTVIRRSSDPLGLGQDDPDLEISTPHTRRAALAEIRASHVNAARRRRNVALMLIVSAIGLGIATPLTVLPWWSALVPTALLGMFLVVARFSVVTLTRRLDERAREVRQGWDEQTVALAIEVPRDATEESIELSGPITETGSLWDPIPVTAPTYVSKPLVPRTVRTIDLTAPAVPPSAFPVTADAHPLLPLDEPEVEDDARPRAAGE